MSAPLRILVVGAGRMGRAFLDAAAPEPDIAIVAAVVKPGDPAIGRPLRVETAAGSADLRVVDDGAPYLEAADVVVEFAEPQATARYARAAADAGRPFVSGTTGLDAGARAALDAAAGRVAVFHAPNMSVGVAVLADLVKQAVARLGESFDVEIVERHHRGKADAPSGTAIHLAEAARSARAGAALVHGRQGRTGPRPPGEIGVHAVRAGEIVGEHAVLLAGAGEFLELSHAAISRTCFARGALRAARFVAAARPGLYGMEDLLRAGTGSLR